MSLCFIHTFIYPKSDRYTGNWAGYNPYLFDYDLNPKLSYYSVVDALEKTAMVQ